MPRKLEAGIETVRRQIVVPKTWDRRVEEWRAKQRPIPSISEAIRILVDKGIESEK